MDADRWRRMEEIFAQAVDRPADAREAFVRDACAEDSELCQSVLELLEQDSAGTGRIGGAIGAQAERAVADTRAVAIGQRIGPYRIVREIGRGGMGTVYLAVRDDDEFEQQVAIKLMGTALARPDLVARFRSERQILARLDHPNVARLLDGGTTDAGLPYVVMEHVEGQPIDAFCQAQELTTRQRLRLFRDVCAAVHYAHRNLIVHRDLKPSNILVSADGVPKLLDFGIAKLLDPSLEPAESPATQTAARMMTPEYASPEQVRGEAITTASDVYSLGVLLYELLTGQRPYDVSRAGLGVLEQAICESQPDRPSAAALRSTGSETTTRDPAVLRRELRGDLDNIVLMALRKEPERRYASAEQLSQDIERYLGGFPVQAVSDSASYRLRKFVRRNAGAVAAAIAVVALLATVIGFYTYRLAEERDRARIEADKATQVSEFLVELFDGADPARGQGAEITARELLDLGSRRVESELAGQPEVQATMMTLMGRVHRSLGDFDKARQLVERALEIRREVFGQRHPAVTDSLFQLGSVHAYELDYARAEEIFGEVLDRRMTEYDEAHVDVVHALHNLAWSERELGKLEESEAHLEQALTMAHELHGDEHADIAALLKDLSSVAQMQDRQDEAVALQERAHAMARRVLGEDHPQTIRHAMELASRHNEPDKLGPAIALLEQTIASARRVFGDDHSAVADMLQNLAVNYATLDQGEKALAAYRESLAIRRRAHGERSPHVAQSIYSIGTVQLDLGLLDEAEASFEQSLAIMRESLPPGHGHLSFPIGKLGELFAQRGRHRRAEALLREAIALRKTLWPEHHWRIADLRVELARSLTAQGRFSEAETLLVPAQPILEESLGTDHATAQRVRDSLRELYEAWRQPEKAKRSVN